MIIYIILDNLPKFFYSKITVDTNPHDNHVAGENSIVTVAVTVPDGTVALYGICIADPVLTNCPFRQKVLLFVAVTLTITLVAVTCDESDIDADITKYVLVPS